MQAALLAPPPLPARRDEDKVQQVVPAAVQTQAALPSSAETYQLPSEAAEQNGAVGSTEQIDSQSIAGASHDEAASSADGIRPEAETAACDEPTTAVPHSGNTVSLLLHAAPEQSPSSNEHSAASDHSTDAQLSVATPTADAQQAGSKLSPQQVRQQLSDVGDAEADVDGLDSISTRATSSLAEPQTAARQELPLSPTNQPPPALSEQELAAAYASQQPAAEGLSAEPPQRAVASGAPATATAGGLQVSSAASSAVLSALDSAGSQASLSALSLDADSMQEPELDQLSVTSLDDAAASLTDGLDATSAKNATRDSSAAAGDQELLDGVSDGLAGGLSDSEADFDTAGELTEPQLASGVEPPSATVLPSDVEPVPALAAVKPAEDWGHAPLLDTQATAEEAPVSRNTAGDAATARQPFAARAASTAVDHATTVSDDSADLRPWEADLAAAEAVEAELLRGTERPNRVATSSHIMHQPVPAFVAPRM